MQQGNRANPRDTGRLVEPLEPRRLYSADVGRLASWADPDVVDPNSIPPEEAILIECEGTAGEAGGAGDDASFDAGDFEVLILEDLAVTDETGAGEDGDVWTADLLPAVVPDDWIAFTCGFGEIDPETGEPGAGEIFDAEILPAFDGETTEGEAEPVYDAVILPAFDGEPSELVDPMPTGGDEEIFTILPAFDGEPAELVDAVPTTGEDDGVVTILPAFDDEVIYTILPAFDPEPVAVVEEPAGEPAADAGTTDDEGSASDDSAVEILVIAELSAFNTAAVIEPAADGEPEIVLTSTVTEPAGRNDADSGPVAHQVAQSADDASSEDEESIADAIFGGADDLLD